MNVKRIQIDDVALLVREGASSKFVFEVDGSQRIFVDRDQFRRMHLLIHTQNAAGGDDDIHNGHRDDSAND